MKSSALVRWALVLSLFMWSQIVCAATYVVTITGTPGLTQLTFTAGAPGAPSIVTAVSGKYNGQDVTGLTNFEGTNNAFNIGGNLGFVTQYGIGITYGTGPDYVALWSEDGTADALPGLINRATDTSNSYNVTSSVLTSNSAPLSKFATLYNISLTDPAVPTNLGPTNLTFTAGAPGAPSIVTAVSGTFNGQIVTGLNNLCQASNVINSTRLGFVDYGGISVTYGSGSDYVNLFFNNYSYLPGPINLVKINCGWTPSTRFDVNSSTPSYVDALTLSSVSPASGSTAGGTSITITGTNLTGATGITVGGVACTAFNAVSSTSATCTTPAGTAGTVSVLVTTAGGTNSANTLFTYAAPVSSVASIPTLSEWAMILMASLLGMFAFIRLRKN